MGAETAGVERPAIEWLIQLGYIHRHGNSLQQEYRHLAPVLDDVLRERLLALNPWLAHAAGGVDAPLLELRKRVQDELMPANKAFWNQVLHKSDIQVKDADGRPRSVRFFDATDRQANHFHVVDQYTGSNADGELFRPDLLLFVNGLPLAIIENKASHHRMDEALAQLDGYQRTFPAHFVYNQVCVGLNRRDARYGAILTPPDFYAHYRLEASERASVEALLGHEASEQEQLLWALFEPSRFLQLVTHFVLFETRDGKTIKKLPRYQQWRSVRKAVDRLTGKGPGKLAGRSVGGVIWHTQGSGKSLTMALLARLLRAESTGLNNPSVLVLTDRTDLDRQIRDTFHAVGIPAIQATSVDGLVKLLLNDYGSVFTSTVQKFQEREDAEAIAPLTDAPEDAGALRRRRIRDGQNFFIVEEFDEHFGQYDATGTPLPAKWVEIRRNKVDFRVLSTKDNFFVLVDEAHRSQYDFLAAFMRASLPNAKFIAFTGTPLLQEDKHTLAEFGGGEYIDEYRLHEAVADGATLPIKYLDAYAELMSKAGLEKDFTDTFGQESAARQQALKQALLANWRKAGDRMDKVAEHLVEHFLGSVHSKGLKAMLVCDGRDMVVRYKDKLDAIMLKRAAQGLPTFESRVAISLASITANRTGASVAEAAAKYGLGIAAVQSIEERIREETKAGKTPVALPADQVGTFVSQLFPLPYGDETPGQDGKPHGNNIGLVIVSDMLLTGWDAPIVSTMYLDKPLKQHTLLQAIARVNRTRTGKSAGYIVDYHGVVEHLDEALKIYGGDVQPAQVWTGVESELPRLQAAQERILNLLPKKHDPLRQAEDYKLDAEKFLDPSERLDAVEDFLQWVKEFNRLLDIVLPDVRAIPFKPFFDLFSEIRLMLRDKLPDATYRERITTLESALLQQMLDTHIEASPAKSLLGHEVSILDASDMERLKKLTNASSQALVMKNQLRHTIRTGKDKDPAFFGKLEEALDKLLEEEKAGRISLSQFLEQLELFSQLIHDKGNTGFSDPAHSAVFHYLESHLGEDSARPMTIQLFADEDLAKTLGNAQWKRMHDLHPEVRDHLRKLLVPLAGWERSTAREHAGKILDILLKN